MSQTTVSAGGQPIGFAGMVADSGIHDIVSGFSQEATNPIPFGVGLRAGTSPDGYLMPTGFSIVLPIEGVSVFSFDHNRVGTVDPNGNFSGDMGASGIVPKGNLQVMRKGRILVPVEGTVRRGDPAFCRGIATGASSNGNIGIWSGTGYGAMSLGVPASPSYHVDCTKAAQFRSGSFTAADGSTLVAVLEVDFTTHL